MSQPPTLRPLLPARIAHAITHTTQTAKTPMTPPLGAPQAAEFFSVFAPFVATLSLCPSGRNRGLWQRKFLALPTARGDGASCRG
jgi:hypothetical protein